MSWHYHDLINIYKKLSDRGYHFIYLTSRTFSDYKSTRSYIEGVVHDKEKLPPGPIFMYPKTFFGVLRTDVITKTADVNIDFIIGI